MKATTCQMSNVCCAMCNVVVKAPNDLLTRRPNPQWENDFVILSLGQWVLGQVHWTSHNRHSTFENCGSTPGEPSPGALRRLIHSHSSIHLRGRRGVYALQPVRRCARSPRSSSDCHESARVGKHRASAA